MLTTMLNASQLRAYGGAASDFMALAREYTSMLAPTAKDGGRAITEPTMLAAVARESALTHVLGSGLARHVRESDAGVAYEIAAREALFGRSLTPEGDIAVTLREAAARG